MTNSKELRHKNMLLTHCSPERCVAMRKLDLLSRRCLASEWCGGLGKPPYFHPHHCEMSLMSQNGLEHPPIWKYTAGPSCLCLTAARAQKGELSSPIWTLSYTTLRRRSNGRRASRKLYLLTMWSEKHLCIFRIIELCVILIYAGYILSSLSESSIVITVLRPEGQL